jgi:hypothetical protein
MRSWTPGRADPWIRVERMQFERLRGIPRSRFYLRSTMKRKSTEQSPKDCRDCDRWNEVQERIRVSDALEKTIKAIEIKIKSKNFKPTMAEFLKLIQLEKEMKQGDAKEIKVTWVEPAAMSEPEK